MARSKNYYAWYEQNAEHLKTVARKNVQQRRKRNQDFMLKYLAEHPCVDCGETNIVTLHCDHIKKKTYNIGDLITKGRNINMIRKELKQCEVVCANCHTIRTQRRKHSYRVQYIDGTYEFGDNT